MLNEFGIMDESKTGAPKKDIKYFAECRKEMCNCTLMHNHSHTCQHVYTCMIIGHCALTISIKLIMVDYVQSILKIIFKLTCFCTVLGMVSLGQLFHFVSITPSYLKQKTASMPFSLDRIIHS